MLPSAHPGPIDFYRDYVAHGTLTDGRGGTVPAPVTREVLNAHKDDPRATFVYQPGVHQPGAAGSGPCPTSPTVYGRVDRERAAFPTPAGPVTISLTFLTYHAVFAVSGLPAGLPAWQAWPLRLVASLDDWHQLDHYTAVTLALDEALIPVAVIFQQHNHLRSYLAGVELPLPADGRVLVDVALRSNELYPHTPGRSRRRAVSMPTPAAVRYLMTGQQAPLLSADDVTDSRAEVDYRLEFLPPDDAFYTFQGFLGERRWLRGRSGPPGSDYNTRPALKARATQMLAFYWREGDAGDLSRFEASLASPEPFLAFAAAQAAVFYQRWPRRQR